MIHHGRNKIFAAIDSLFVIYFYGKKGVPQDLNKAKHYIEMAAKNGSRKHQHFLNNWHTHVFLLKTQQESDKCVEKNRDDPKWVNKCIESSEKK